MSGLTDRLLGRTKSTTQRPPDTGEDIPPSTSQQPLNRSARAVPTELDPSSTTGGNLNTVRSSPITKYDKFTKTITHRRIMSSFGYQYCWIQADHTDDFNTVFAYCTTPYARIPCNGIPFYMSPIEFAHLPLGTEVKKCSVSIRAISHRTPFVTQTSTVKAVNAISGLTCMYGFGLNNKYQGINLKYVTTASDPCIVTGITPCQYEGCEPDMFWGKRVTTDGTLPNYEDIGANFGRTIPISQYYTHYIPLKANDEFLPNIYEDIETFALSNTSEAGPTIDWEYRPQICILKPMGTSFGYYYNQKNKYETRIKYGMKLRSAAQYRRLTNRLTWNAPEVMVDSDYPSISRSMTGRNLDPFTDYKSFYTTYIEHCGSSMHGLQEYGGGLYPPSLHVGMMPNNAFYQTPDMKAIQSTVVDWEVTTHIDLESSTQMLDPYMSFQPPNSVSTFNIDEITIGHYPYSSYGYQTRIDNITPPAGFGGSKKR